MINLRCSELPGLLGLEYCPRSGLVGISHKCDIHCGLGYPIWSGLIWSGLVQQVALRVFITIDADADPTAMVKMQSSATICSVGMIQTSMFNLISTMVSFM